MIFSSIMWRQKHIEDSYILILKNIMVSRFISYCSCATESKNEKNDRQMKHILCIIDKDTFSAPVRGDTLQFVAFTPVQSGRR